VYLVLTCRSINGLNSVLPRVVAAVAHLDLPGCPRSSCVQLCAVRPLGREACNAG
jgi:hypothetical protein